MITDRFLAFLVPIGIQTSVLCALAGIAFWIFAMRRERIWVKGLPGERRLPPVTLRKITWVCFVLAFFAFSQAFATHILVMQHEINSMEGILFSPITRGCG